MEETRKSRKLVFSIATAGPPESSPLPSVHPRKQMSEPGRCTAPSPSHKRTHLHTEHNTILVRNQRPAARGLFGTRWQTDSRTRKKLRGGSRVGKLCEEECVCVCVSGGFVYRTPSFIPPPDGAAF